MRSICLRLRRGDDLLLSIRQLAAREDLRCAVVLSGVGCVTEARVRDASGVTVRRSCPSTGRSARRGATCTLLWRGRICPPWVGI